MPRYNRHGVSGEESEWRSLSRGERDLPDADELVRVAGEEGLSIGGPGEGEAVGGLAGREHFLAELVHHHLPLQVLRPHTHT